MNPSAARVLSYADVPAFLDSLERQIADAMGVQWGDLERGDLALWIQKSNGVVTKTILRQDLADEFRSHEGIRCAILDSLAEGSTGQIAGMEKTIDIVRIESAKKKETRTRF